MTLEQLQQQALDLYLATLQLDYDSRVEIAKDFELMANRLRNPKTTKKGRIHK